MGDQIIKLTRAGIVLAGLVVVGMWWCVPPAEAGIVRGIGSIVAGVFALPVNIIQGTFSGPPVLGTLIGAVNGTINTVTLLAGGTLDILSDAVPLAQAAAPFVLPFLF